MQEEQDQNAKEKNTNSKKRHFQHWFTRKKTRSKHPTTEDQKKNADNVNKEPYNIIINIPEKEDSSVGTANKIAFINMIVTAALTLFTYLLFLQTKHTLDEYKKEFEEVNRPDIIVTNFKIDTISNSSNMIMTFQIINTGKFRAKIKTFKLLENLGKEIGHYTATGIRRPVNENDMLQNNAAFNPNDLLQFTATQKKDFIAGNIYLFVNCDYEYSNDAINKSYITHELFKIHYTGKLLGEEKLSLTEDEENIK